MGGVDKRSVEQRVAYQLDTSVLARQTIDSAVEGLLP